MDKLSLAGLLLGIGGILGGQLLEGGELSILFQGAAFIIVFGGTLGAVMLQSPLNIFLSGHQNGPLGVRYTTIIPTEIDLPDYLLEQTGTKGRNTCSGATNCQKQRFIY